MATKIRKKKRCINGTSCGYSCINKMKICRVDLNEQTNNTLNRIEEKRKSPGPLKKSVEKRPPAAESNNLVINDEDIFNWLKDKELKKPKESDEYDWKKLAKKDKPKRLEKKYTGPKRNLDAFVKNGDGVLSQFGFKDKLNRDEEEKNQLILKEKMLDANSASLGKKIADIQKMSWGEAKKKYKIPDNTKSKDEYIAKLRSDRVKILDELDIIADRRDALELEAFEDLRNKLLNRKSTDVNQIMKDNFWLTGKGNQAEKDAVGGGIRSLNESELRDAQSNLKEFIMLMGGRELKLNNGERIQLIYDEDRGNRAYAKNRFVHIGKGSKKELFHEIAHHLEKNDKEIYDAAAEFREKRAFNSKVEKLKDIDSLDYGDDEVAYRGNYIKPYMGKVYDGQQATEVISMGIEMMSSPRSMKKLYEQDPELFSFILGVITADD